MLTEALSQSCQSFVLIRCEVRIHHPSLHQAHPSQAAYLKEHLQRLVKRKQCSNPSPRPSPAKRSVRPCTRSTQLGRLIGWHVYSWPLLLFKACASRIPHPVTPNVSLECRVSPRLGAYPRFRPAFLIARILASRSTYPILSQRTAPYSTAPYRTLPHRTEPSAEHVNHPKSTRSQSAVVSE